MAHSDESDASVQADLPQCDFCGRTAAATEPLGEATAYIHDINEEGYDTGGSPETVRICVACATATTPQPDDTQKGRCDLCETVGWQLASRPGAGEIGEKELLTWRIEALAGLSGSITVCRDCTPVKTAAMYPYIETTGGGNSGEPIRHRREPPEGTPATPGTAPQTNQAVLDVFADGGDTT